MVAFWEDAGVLRLNARDEGIKLVQHTMSDNALVNFILLWYVVYYVCVLFLVDRCKRLMSFNFWSNSFL
jgi:hypothetical protein